MKIFYLAFLIMKTNTKNVCFTVTRLRYNLMGLTATLSRGIGMGNGRQRRHLPPQQEPETCMFQHISCMEATFMRFPCMFQDSLCMEYTFMHVSCMEATSMHFSCMKHA